MSTLRRNFVYKFLSLVIAILLYWIASGQNSNPPVKGEFYVQPIPEGLPDNLILKAPPQGSPVSVSGTAAAMNAFRALEPKATVDLTNAQIGANRYPVKYRYPNGFADSLEIIGPPTSLVTVEKKTSAKFVVEVLFNNNPPAGYEYSEPRSVPSQVQVVGLNADVMRVGRVVANLDTSGAPGAVSQEVELVAQDIKYQPVENVQIIPNRVKATLGLKTTSSTKTVLLSIELNGSPEPGYEIKEYKFVPPMVTISGSQDLLSSRSSLRVPVDVDGIKANTTRTVTIEPPAGLRVVGNSTARLRLWVKPIETANPAPPPTPAASTPSPLPSTTPPAVEARP